MEKNFLYGDVTINYSIEGDGKNVVLIHGFPEDNHIWDNQVAFLKQHCRLILPDLPGSGKSGMLTLATEVSITDYADCIYALLQHEAITDCIMCGHSMGGYIALAFAEKYPSLLSGLGLIHSTAFADSEEKKLNRQRSIETMAKYGAYAFLKSTVPNLFSVEYKARHADKIQLLIEAGNKFQVEALQQYYTAMMNRPNRTQVLKGSGIPVLFILGEEDVAAPLNDVLQQVHLPATAYFHVLEHVAHMGMWEAPELVNKYLLEFIRSF